MSYKPCEEISRRQRRNRYFNVLQRQSQLQNVIEPVLNAENLNINDGVQLRPANIPNLDGRSNSRSEGTDAPELENYSEEDSDESVLSSDSEENFNESGEDSNEGLDGEAENERRHHLPRNHGINNQPNEPLYRGARITVKESMLLILALLLHHNLTMTCIQDIITVLELHCAHEDLKKNSLYKFQNYFGLNGVSNFSKNYYCSICTRELNDANEICPSCPRVKNSYFVQLSIQNQLREMYARPGFYERAELRFGKPRHNGIFSDVYDGRLYRTWVDNGFLSNPNNISFSWYTDGIPVFKSSKISIWPIYLTINELPFEDRKKRHNILLVGYWYGDKKPNMNMFFYKFRPELETISRGIDIVLPNRTTIFVRGVVLMGTCDLPAKCDCLNFTHFNGNYGCATCLCKGENHQLGPRSHVHIYPYEVDSTLRTTNQCIEDADIANLDAPVRGVKGHSALSRIMPDFIQGMAIDRMHCVDGGVVKKMLTLLFDSKYNTFLFSLYHVKHIISNRLIAIKPPKFIHRMPRSIEDLIHWKASELKMFFFYYSIPVFEGVMRADYFEHYLRLVISLAILSSEQITEFEIEIASDLLHSFVREFQVMYGIQFCSINIHQLLHLPNCVRNLGPLWCHTCFEYEDLNGQLLKLIHGTWHIDTQIANAQSRFIKMIGFIEQLPDGNVRNFCLKKKKQVRINEKINQHCYSVGVYKNLPEIPAVIINALQNSGILFNNVHLSQYSRLLKDDKLYVSGMYTRALQTQSSVVQYYKDEQKKIGGIHCFVKLSRCNGHQMQNECGCISEHYAILEDLVYDRKFVATGDNYAYHSSKFLFTCHATNFMKAVPVETLETVCIYMHIDETIYVAVPINKQELE